MNVARILTLVGKELRELRANPGALVPMVILFVPSVLLPVLVLRIIPQLTGHPLGDDEDIRQVIELAIAVQPALADLPIDAAAQAFLLQQLLFLFLIGPIVGAVSLAAYSVVGEKQARTLEPLLTTPLSTTEILVAKVVAALLPALAAEAIGFVLFVVLVEMLAAPGVPDAVLTTQTAVLLGVVGPLAALAALQLAIAISARVNDARSAQQLSGIIVLPLAGMLVGQITGAFIIDTATLLAGAVGLAAFWVVLATFSVALFQRETVLTRWN